MIGRASGSQRLFSDNVGGNASFYYWVRAFNQNGDYGAYNSSAGTLGTTQPDIDFLLGELTDQITSSQLATDLATSISLISADSDTAGSVAYQVAQESFARAAAILAESTARTLALTDEASARQAAITASATALQNQINDLLDTAPYDASVSYAVGDQVTYDDKLYKALQATLGNLPTDAS
jgi:predicted phage tail protein